MKIKIAFLVLCLTLSWNGFSQIIKSENWQKDIDTYHQILESKHIDLYNRISKEEFEEEIKSIHSLIADEAADFEIVLELMRLTRKIGDGHTSVSIQKLKRHVYP